MKVVLAIRWLFALVLTAPLVELSNRAVCASLVSERKVLTCCLLREKYIKHSGRSVVVLPSYAVLICRWIVAKVLRLQVSQVAEKVRYCI